MDIKAVACVHNLQHRFRLNVNKCKSVSYGRCIEYASEYTVSGIVIDKVDKIKDIGIVFDYRLKFDEHIDEKLIKHIRC